MNFAEAYDALEVGQRVRVSDGNPPPREGSLAWNIWRSHNFEGEYTGAGGTSPYRELWFDLDPDPNVEVSYGVYEGPAHTFELI